MASSAAMMAGSVAKNLDLELQAVEDEPATAAKLIRVVCRMKKIVGDVPTCIKSMTQESVAVWSTGSANISTASSKKRKHNNSQDIGTTTCKFTFDRVYSGNTSQQQFYEGEVRTCVGDLVAGRDSTMFAYGNTSSGKSYTIFGQPKSTSRAKTDGILFRVVKEVFKLIGDAEGFEMKISAFEIYNEKVQDLLDSDISSGKRKHLKWRARKGHPVKVEGLKNFSAKTLQTAETLLMTTANNRTIAETNLNHRSSRSHCVFTIQLMKDNKSHARLVVVDLAGSERAARTKAKGAHLKEANKINQSLMTLNRCLRIMRDNQDAAHKQHVPFRDSKLTSFFQHNLTNPRSGAITMIVNVNPAISDHAETISVLENSSIAKDVVYTKPVVEKVPKTTARKYDEQGRRIKSKKEIAAAEAKAKRQQEKAEMSTSTKSHRKKKFKLATSQNIDNQETRAQAKTTVEPAIVVPTSIAAPTPASTIDVEAVVASAVAAAKAPLLKKIEQMTQNAAAQRRARL